MQLLFAFCFLTLLSLSQALSCKTSSDCLSVTSNEDFVQCIDSKCACLSAHGFSGSATIHDRCSCSAPGRLHYLSPKPEASGFLHVDLKKRSEHASTLPLCIDLDGSVLHTQQKRREDHNVKVIELLYNSLIWPEPPRLIHQLTTNNTRGGLWDLVDDNAIGRVDPLGEFDTKDGIVEYFVGTVWLPVTRVSKAVVKKVAAKDDLVAIRAQVTFDLYDPSNPIDENYLFSYNLTQSGFFTFNEKGQIKSMDLIIHNLGFGPASQVQHQPNLIFQTCYSIVQLAKCNASHDPHGYYSSMEDCVAFMNTIPIGNWDNLRANTVVCRSFHSYLAMARPEMHCPHSGKTGIGHDGHRYCTDHTYHEYFFQEF